MDSTMVYQLVLEQLHKKQELVNLIPSLTHLTQPQALVRAPQMNDQQIFKQIHSHVNSQLAQIQKDKEQILSAIEMEDGQEEEQQEEMENEEPQLEGEEDQMEGEEQNDWEVGEEDEEGDPYGQIDEQDEEDEQAREGQDGSAEQQLYDGQDDVGLYGQRIDDQQLQSYENQGDSQEERQFEQQQRQLKKKSKLYKNHQQEEQEDEGQDLMNDQFDNFREIELQNKEEPIASQEKTALQKQIEKYQNKIMNKKDWVLQGQVKGTQRPVNSLLQYDLQFKTGLKINQQVTKEYNEEVEIMIKQRILDELYDDRVRYQHSHVLREQYSSLKEVSTQKSKLGLAELYQSQFKNYLGLGDNKQDKLRKEILQSFRQVNYFLDSLSNHHFTPRPNTSQQQAVISEQKVPITMFGNSSSVTPVSGISHKFQSQKEQNKKAKRTKNKRIARQRKKEQDKKKLNKKIQYGGMTKFEAKAISKKAKNSNLNKDPIKYNKSSNFFSQMNKGKGGKPNPNINKLKI